MSDDENIFLFVPNLIGFGRVVLGVASLFYMESDPVPAMARRVFFYFFYFLARGDSHQVLSCINMRKSKDEHLLLMTPPSRTESVHRSCTGRLLSSTHSMATPLALLARVGAYWLRCFEVY